MAKILIIDDEPMILRAFAEFLEDEGHTALLAGDGDTGLRQLRAARPEIVFLDYRLPERDGLALLAEIKAADPGVAVIFMTAFGAMDVAIRAMQLGAHEYLTKPLALEQVGGLIADILAARCLREEADISRIGATPAPPGQMVGSSPAMQEIYKKIGILTVREVTVLITGESGVGKELVARAIHDNSARAPRPFVAVNCGAIPDNLLESELFGHERGAFTGAEARKMGKFEAAAGGTIFLDEIGELPLLMQVKLLRVLQEQSFFRLGGTEAVRSTARVMAATNRDLQEEINAGRFRQDLFYRLNLVHIHIPPLRQRPQDLGELITHCIAKANRELDLRVSGLSQPALAKLLAYSWPGNVRELENQIKQAMVLCRDEILDADLFLLPAIPGKATPAAGHAALDLTLTEVFAAACRDGLPEEGLLPRVIRQTETVLIREALARHGGNQVKAASTLGLHRTTLRHKMKEYGM